MSRRKEPLIGSIAAMLVLEVFAATAATEDSGDKPVVLEAPDSDDTAVQKGIPTDAVPLPMPIPKFDETRELADELEKEPPVSSEAAAPEQVER